MNGEPPRRDPRRLFTAAERRQVAAKQQHACAVCHDDLPAIFHVHHVIPWSDGGRTESDNGMAVCPDCHRKAPVQTPQAFIPRTWQLEALPEVLPVLRAGEFATLNAAPGAGKTLFTAWVYRNLAAMGDRHRLVVFVPNANLRDQWVDEVPKLGIYLDANGTSERRSRDGVVLTYHVLSDPIQVEQIMADAANTPTLFVLDEVHHLGMRQGGEAGAWSVNIARVVGTIDQPIHPALNLSGTLFRSKKTEQISTIKYLTVGDQIETVANYSVTAGRLIAEQQLRHIKVLGYDQEMTVHAVDLASSAHAGAETIRAVDLDGNTQLRSKVLSELIRHPRFVQGILTETVKRLGHASVALRRAPVKGLVIADSIEHAEQLYEALAAIIGPRNSFIAHGETSSPLDEIKRFRYSTGQAVMVAVQMVTEGFDVPDICVLTYLRTWRAPLFINQMVGRAMRITDRERQLETYLPATILVPNEAQVKAAFADVLVGSMQVLTAPPEPCSYCGREICACPPRPRQKDKHCPRCEMPWTLCVCTCDQCGLSRYRGCRCRWIPGPNQDTPPEVDVIGDLELAHVNVDGQDVDVHIVESLQEYLLTAGTPAVFLEQSAGALQKLMEADPMALLSYLNRSKP